ncbi:protein kinase domain-containing protein [Sulfurimonas sp.]
MIKGNIKTSGFTLAKRKELTGDDFYDVKTIGNLSVAIVCDGVGSADYGAEAAKRTTEYLINNFKIRPKSWSIEKSIKTFVTSINAILYQESQINYERSELITTLAIVVIEGHRLYGANVGDSRVYIHRDNLLNQISVDHAMDEKGYENVLTQAIGIDKDVEIHYFENTIQEKDKILLCSDGLYNIMSEEKLEENISLDACRLVKKASSLVHDNLPDDTTAVVIEILKIDEREILKRQALPIPEVLKEGEVIDGYLLEKSLIQNKRTWACKKKHKRYVLKFAPLEAENDITMLDLFVKEAWNAKRLKANYFPKAVIPKNRTKRYYVMQYLDGESLEAYIQKKQLSVDDSVELAKTLLAMGAYLVKQDLVHGDIKPHNIMVLKDSEGNLKFKIIDFGNITEIFSTNSKAGTPSFLSPQRFQGEAISETSEIFSIGVTLYLALTKKYPYGEIEPFTNPYFKEAQKPSKYNNNIPNWLESIILRAIAISPDKRYEHYSEMLYEIQKPEKVKPYFNENSSIIERDPVLFYRIGFTLMSILNIILLMLLLK